ncbi:MAG TPA: type II toxin-antitoxin system VapC family toxin [Sporichthyaceae bacterium]|jgi:hypothetical protein|nr:type II toxin-antitoxin system VapC family toxin [Sporichthyaceae bacterium]
MNYLLDTNAVSETRKARPDVNVRDWFERTHADALYLGAMVVGEIRVGIERLRRRDPTQVRGLDSWLGDLIAMYSSRIIPVDIHVAQEWGKLEATYGPLPVMDGVLAATARIHELTVVTRNVIDFERAGVRVLNPWLHHA